MRLSMCLIAALFVAFAGVSAASAATPDPENTLYMDLPAGRVVIKMRPDLAPKHVAQIKALTRQGFYDGTPFHRVMEGFMAQGGDPTGTGSGSSDLPDLKAELTDTPFVRGTIGMARGDSPDSANSQFFICFDDASGLNGAYTVWGEVVSGMEFVDKLKKGSLDVDGVVDGPDRLIKVQVAADVK